MVDVALFPIPRSVTFPGMPYPLHVFEPRYRQMVRHCLARQMPIGICHTEKILHANTREQTLQEALHSNQSTYKPRDVFSAGPVELLSEMDDGRMMISVHANERLVLREERQALPFSVWACDRLEDDAGSAEDVQAMEQLREKILTRLLFLTRDNEVIQAHLKDGPWLDMTPLEFSFTIAGSLGMDPDFAQQLLEMTDTQQRLQQLLALLNQVGQGLRPG